MKSSWLFLRISSCIYTYVIICHNCLIGKKSIKMYTRQKIYVSHQYNDYVYCNNLTELLQYYIADYYVCIITFYINFIWLLSVSDIQSSTWSWRTSSISSWSAGVSSSPGSPSLSSPLSIRARRSPRYEALPGSVGAQISVLQGVTVTQSGVVLSTVFIATLIFTPIFGKEFVNNLLSGNISNQRLFILVVF